MGSKAYLRQAGVTLPAFQDEAEVASNIFVAEAGTYAGKIQVADGLRSGAREAMDSLHNLGIRTFLFTGDARAIARAIGRELAVDQVEDGLLPEDKLGRVRNLRAEGAVVAMVGDGVNDAPALVSANVGIAVGSGTDVARESASVVLLGDDLGRLADLFRIARQCSRTIMINFFGTIAVDAAGVALAAAGMLNPILAVLIHVTSEAAFILNSARLVNPHDLPSSIVLPERSLVR